MTHDRSDPLSTALACVRRLSDEGLDHLTDAIGAEWNARIEANKRAARWYTTRVGRGHADHVVTVPSGARIREGESGSLFTECGRWTNSALRVGIEGEPTCIPCCHRWKRPA